MNIVKIALVLFLSSVILNAEHIKIQLLKKIEIKKKSGDAKSIILFDDEKEQKKNYILEGTFKNKKMLSGKTEVSITWDKVKKGQAKVNLDESFDSKLITKDDIDSKAEFKANGDNKQLENSLNTLLNDKNVDKVDNNDNTLLSENGLLEENENTDEDAKTSTASNGMSLGNSKNDTASNANLTDSPISNSLNDTLDNTASDTSDSTIGDTLDDTLGEDEDESETSCENIVNTDTIQFKHIVNNKCIDNGSPVPIFEVTDGCSAKIDFDKKIVNISTKKIATLNGETITIDNCSIKADITPLKSTFTGCTTIFRKDKVAKVQQEQLYYTYNTEDIKIGSCVDSTTIFPVSTFTETNKLCKPLINYSAMEVQFAYRKVANVDDNEVELVPCRYDLEKHTLHTTYKDTQILDDFIHNKSIQMEKLYYIFENKEIYVGEPRESTLSWKHYLTDQTCSPLRVSDEAVVYNQRVAYKDNNGIINYITECKPYADSRLKLFKEFGGYEHDFNNHQSYPRTREYFLHPDTNEITYINDFTKEPVNFPHLNEHDHWEHNDDELYSKEFIKIYFKDTLYAKKNIYTDGSTDGVATELSLTPYVKSLEKAEFLRSLGNYQLSRSDAGNYSFVSAEKSYIINHGNGLFPNNKSATINVTNLTQEVLSVTTQYQGVQTGGIYTTTHKVTYNTCNYGDIAETIKTYKSKRKGSPSIPAWGLFWAVDYNKSYTYKDCIKWKYYEEIGEYNLVTDYLRPDATIFNQNTSKLYRIIK